MNFCPKCENYLYLQQQFTESTNAKGEKEKTFYLNRVCRTCGYTEVDTKGGLINETVVQDRSSEQDKLLLNEFTRLDPTLPHVKTLPCPNTNGYEEKDESGTILRRVPRCPTQDGKEQRDVIIIKYDDKNLKFIYICNVCGQQWRTRS